MHLLRLLIAATVLLACSSGQIVAAQKVRISDDACMAEKIRECIEIAAPTEFLFSGGGQGSICIKPAGMRMPWLTALAATAVPKFSVTNGCVAPYRLVYDGAVQPCSASDIAVGSYTNSNTKCVRATGSILDATKMNLAPPVHGSNVPVMLSHDDESMLQPMIAACRQVVRDLGLLGGSQCMREVNFPDGSILETSLVEALKALSEAVVKGLGERDSQPAQAQPAAPSPAAPTQAPN